MQQRPNFSPPRSPDGGGGGQGRFNRFAKLRRPTREHRINEDITESQVRLVGEKGTELISTRDALARAKAQIQAANVLLQTRAGAELVAEELRLAHRSLGEITGEFTSEDLLTKIFASFCIGK